LELLAQTQVQDILLVEVVLGIHHIQFSLLQILVGVDIKPPILQVLLFLVWKILVVAGEGNGKEDQLEQVVPESFSLPILHKIAK
jgi:hypothetical protein